MTKIINAVDLNNKDISGFIDHGEDKDLQMIYFGWLYGSKRLYIEVYSGKSHKIIAVFREKIERPIIKKGYKQKTI